MTNKAKDIPTIFVIFGATGDLTRKKILPSLFHLFEKERLPKHFKIIGFSRRDWDDDRFREYTTKVLKDHGGGEDKKKLSSFLKLISYQKGDFTKKAGYKSLVDILKKTDKNWNVCSNKLFYLAVPPKFYGVIFENLESSGLSEACSDEEGWTRVLVEKPFGKDAKTAEKLDKLLSNLFKEEQIYRIDHYLGKEMLQNILTFRFANNVFEHSWNNKNIESIYIRLLEEGGVEDRGTFYDGVGALRDVGQNHLLQMLSLITMEHPNDFSSETIREKRSRMLSTLKTPSEEEAKKSFRGQYEGYKKTEGVDSSSKTETYFKVKVFLTHPKWSGVPVTLESGKKMDEQIKEIVVTFRHPTPCLCPPEGHFQNRVIFSLEPKEEIRVEMFSKKPGLEMQTTRREFTLPYRGEKKKAQYTEEYEKLLLDAIVGDQTLFITTEEVQSMWKYIDPIIDVWEKDEVSLKVYKAGDKKLRKEAAVEKKPEIEKEIGIVGLGKMGQAIAEGLLAKDWRVVGYNRSPEVTKSMEEKGLDPTFSYDELSKKLKKPRVIWVMVPAGEEVDEVIEKLKSNLEKGDIVIDAGNSYFEDSKRHAEMLNKEGIEFVDVGVSGGPEGAKNGASLMIGGKRDLYEKFLPLYIDLSVPQGHQHFEGVGAGHFVKMVHNGIEYGMMQSIAEGFDVMKNSDYKLHLQDVARVYNNGSVIESRLLGWMAEAFALFEENLGKVSGKAGSGGAAGMEKSEARWTLDVAKKLGIETKVIEDSINTRLKSQKEPNFQGRIINALRNRFGGHGVEGDGN